MLHIDINQILQTLEIYSQPLLQYGSIALFVLLALGIVIFPIPEESLLIAAGFLIAKGKLLMIFTVPAAYLGSACGITASYAIGRTAGSFIVKKYGRWIGLTHKKTIRVEQWFQRFGVWTLFFGYFILGVRHITGYVAGTLRLQYSLFALFAYSGLIIWCTAFLLIGYWLGQWY